MCRLLAFIAALLAVVQPPSAETRAEGAEGADGDDGDDGDDDGDDGEDRVGLEESDVVAVTSFVETFVAEAVAILTNQSLPPERRDEAFRAMLLAGFDTYGGARFALGRGWRMATRDQRNDFVALFRRELLRMGKELFEGYERGEVLEVVRARPLGAGKFRVETKLTNPDARIGDIDFLVRKSGARLQIVDVRLEGFSLLETYRSEFVPPLFQGGAERVLRHLRPREAF